MDLELISFIEPKIPLLNGDLLRIKQIIMNILNNHISHCGDGSVIFIRYEHSLIFAGGPLIDNFYI
jgi:signal transduction histidine kinase